MLSKTDNHNYVYAANTRDIEAAGGCLSVTVEKAMALSLKHDALLQIIDLKINDKVSTLECMKRHAT